MSNFMFTTDQKLDQGGQEEDAKCCEDPPAWLWRGWQGRFLFRFLKPQREGTKKNDLFFLDFSGFSFDLSRILLF